MAARRAETVVVRGATVRTWIGAMTVATIALESWIDASGSHA
jgi:hypothetical protein